MSPPVRWGILGTANIARRQFLPGLVEAGGGRAVVVGGRDGSRAAAFAAAEGVERGVEGYEAVVTSPEVDAVYVALPNALHATWVMRALECNKAVLCEKLLCRDVAEATPVLERARRDGALLWEAFAFPFQDQHRRLLELVAAGAIGEPREITSSFHFRVADPGNIRLDAALGGGALADVGCYPVRLAQEIFGPFSGPEPGEAVSCRARRGKDADAVAVAVDTETAAIVDWADRRLLVSVGFERSYDTFTRVCGTAGQIELTNPYHPGPADSLTVLSGNAERRLEHPTTDRRSFSAALRHIHRSIRGEVAPSHLAAADTLPTLRVLDALQAAWRA